MIGCAYQCDGSLSPTSAQVETDRAIAMAINGAFPEPVSEAKLGQPHPPCSLPVVGPANHSSAPHRMSIDAVDKLAFVIFTYAMTGKARAGKTRCLVSLDATSLSRQKPNRVPERVTLIGRHGLIAKVELKRCAAL